MEDMRCTWDISGHVVDDKWVVEHFKMSPTIGGMKIWFSDLFNGNDDLSKYIKSSLSAINAIKSIRYVTYK